MCKMCLDTEVLLMNRWTDEELKGIELKEHTERFKRTVEECKRKLRVSPSGKKMSEDRVASYCFAAITKTFKEHGMAIFAEAGTEVKIGQGMRVQFTSAFDNVDQSLKLPMDAKTLHTLLTDKLKEELYELLKKECESCGDNE